MTQTRTACLIIFVFAFAAQWLMVVNDLPYWDGWFYHELVVAGDKEKIMREWIGNGRTLSGLIYWQLTRLLGDMALYRAFLIACAAASGAMTYHLLRRYAALSHHESLLAALLGCSFPAYQAHLVSVAFSFGLAMPFFIGGLWLLLAQQTQPGPKKYLTRAAAAALLLCSYISEAFVVAGASLPFILWCNEKQKPAGNWFKSLAVYSVRYADVILLAVGYMAVIQFLMPLGQGKYAHARNLNLMPGSVISHWLAYVSASMDLNAFIPANIKLHRDVNLILLAVALLAGIGLQYGRALGPQAGFYAKRFGIALWLMSAISVPFVIAQRVPGTTGWELRHLVPAVFCAGVMLVCLMGIFISEARARSMALAVLAGLSLITMNKDFLTWQARGAFDHGIINNLKGNPLMQKPVIFFTGINAFYFREVYRGYEWEAMMRAASGNDTHWVILGAPPLTQEVWAREHMNHMWPGETPPVTPESCQLIFQPTPTPDALKPSAGFKYLWLKASGDTELLEQWTKEIAQIQWGLYGTCPFIQINK